MTGSTLHSFKQKFIPWIGLSEPVRISGRVTFKPPGKFGHNISCRRNWVDPLQPVRLVGKPKYPCLLPFKFGQVVVLVEERRNLCSVVLRPCDLFEEAVCKEGRIGHVDPAKYIPRIKKCNQTSLYWKLMTQLYNSLILCSSSSVMSSLLHPCPHAGPCVDARHA